MKFTITLLFISLYGVAALANTNDHRLALNSKIENQDHIHFSRIGDFLDNGITITTKYTEVKIITETEVARLYKFKNSKIKKALAFRTKRNKAKMA